MVRKILTAALILLGVAGTASAQGNGGAKGADSTLTLTSADGVVKKLTMKDLRALPQVEYQLEETDGSAMVVKGPTLRSVATLAGAPTGQNLRGLSMTLALIAEGSDGYKVVYALAEIDEQFGAHRAIVALSQNGAALPASDGPLRIVMADEGHRARWVRNLTAIRIVKAGGNSPS